MTTLESAGARAAAGLSTAGLVVGLLFASPASSQAATVPAASNCASATAAVGNAVRSVKAAQAQVAASTKILKAAQASHQQTRIVTAKAAVASAAKRLAKAKAAAAAHSAQASYACAAPTSAVRARAIGKALQLAATGSGVSTSGLTPTQASSLMSRLVAGAGSTFSLTQLSTIASSLTTPVNAADATALLGSAFSPSQIASLLQGSAGASTVSAVLTQVVAQISSVAGVQAPATVSPSDVWNTVAGLLQKYTPTQAGALVSALRGSMPGASTTATPDEVVSLLNSLLPGLGSNFSASQLSTIVNVANGSAPTAQQIADLLGGTIAPSVLQGVLSGGASTTAGPQVIAQILAALGTNIGQPVDVTTLVGQLTGTGGAIGVLSQVLSTLTTATSGTGTTNPIGGLLGGVTGTLGGILPL